MTILEAVGDYLAANGHGTLGTNLFLAVMPDAPDVTVCVYETAGVGGPVFTLGDGGIVADRPGLQVICRGERGDYPTPRDRAEAIRALLSAVTDVTVSGVNIMRIQPSGSLLPMGEDELGRPMVSVNFDCMVRP